LAQCRYQLTVALLGHGHVHDNEVRALGVRCRGKTPQKSERFEPSSDHVQV
jgi:hypothetical protein